jgi:hypothetical protein
MEHFQRRRIRNRRYPDGEPVAHAVGQTYGVTVGRNQYGAGILPGQGRDRRNKIVVIVSVEIYENLSVAERRPTQGPYFVIANDDTLRIDKAADRLKHRDHNVLAFSNDDKRSNHGVSLPFFMIFYKWFCDVCDQKSNVVRKRIGTVENAQQNAIV